MKYEKLIRSLPKVLIIGAAINFIKDVIGLVLFSQVILHLMTLGHPQNYQPQLVSGAIEHTLAIFLSPLPYIAWAGILSVALAIYDRGHSNA